MPSELELQRVYGLSKSEARLYMMKQDGLTLSDIADYNNVSLQDVKNTLTRANTKIKEMTHPMNLITINQANEQLMRKSVAEMALRILAMDQKLTQFYKGTHSIVLFGVSPNLGDTDFVVKNIFTKIDPLARNENDVKVKSEQIYRMYLDLGGKPGEMGYGWVRWLFDKYYVKYDIY